MKICILGDTHFGMRGDSTIFHNYYDKFYNDVFFPYLEKNNIKQIYQLGDLFDSRKFINFNTLHLCRQYFFNKIKNFGIKLHTILGNHDIYFKNTLEVNSSEILLKEYDNICVYDKPTNINIDGLSIDIVPWICKENQESVFEFLEKSRSEIVFGHFEIAGFSMYRGSISHEGIDKKVLRRYDVVLSGHFHHKSSDGHITYVGTPGEITWSDYNDPRGFHIFDTETRELTFIENPFKIFHKLEYDDSMQSFETWKSFDYSKYKNVYLKIHVKNKKNPYLFDTVLDKILKENPIDVSVVENFEEIQLPEEDVDQSEDTVTILSKYIDQLTLNVDSDKMKLLMRNLYQECLNIDSN